MERAESSQYDAPDASARSGLHDQDAPSATAAVLAASSTCPPQNHAHDAISWICERFGILLGQMRDFSMTFADLFVAAPVRQGWVNIYVVAHARYSSYHMYFRYGFFVFLTLIAITEYEAPGFFPRPTSLISGIIGFLCASAVILGTIAVQEYVDTKKWPWQEEGWVWPWEKWLWQETAYDFGASTNSELPETPFMANSTTRHVAFVSSTPTPRPAPIPVNITSAPQSPPFIIPPTPYLSGGLRPIHLPPPQLHPSGLMGASPSPLFKHFRGDSFRKQENDMRAIKQWSKPQGGRFFDIRKQIAAEKRGGVDDEVWTGNEHILGKKGQPVAWQKGEAGARFGRLVDVQQEGEQEDFENGDLSDDGGEICSHEKEE